MNKTKPFWRRKVNTHKGDYGHIFVLAGSLGYAGAAVLVSASAMRSGAGLVTLGIPKGLRKEISRRLLPEVMIKPLAETRQETLSLAAYKQIYEFAKKTDVLAIGPGLSRNASTQKLVRKIISAVGIPMVIDADGLNALAGHLEGLRGTGYGLRVTGYGVPALPAGRRGTKILTPHLGEFSRLISRTVNYIQKNRLTLAKSFASRYNVVLVLKGNRTLVCEPGGKIYLNHTGNPGMATAGSGDCLTGMIAALLGQGLVSFQAAKLGVYLHGLAGDLAAREKTQAGMIASDIIDKIPEAIKRSRYPTMLA